jgi:protein-disulfide isomerase
VADPLVFWLVFAGVGFELTFVYILAAIRAFCIFCFANAFVVAALAVAVFDPAHVWRAVSAALAAFVASYALIWRENRSRLSPEKESPPGARGVYAEVDGTEITAEEVERPISQQIRAKEMEIYDLKKKRLEKILRPLLLRQEAEAQGKTVEALTEEIAADAGKAKSGKAVDRYAAELEKSHEVHIYLEKPEPRRFSTVEENGSPARGPKDAAVMVAEFSDYRCPACRAAKPTVQKIRKQYEDRVRWVFKNFPLPQHEGAEEMALAAHCAQDQDAFWKFHERLFEDDDIEAEPDSLAEAAEGLELDVEAFRRCLEDEKHRDRIERDRQEGMDAGIAATPTFIVNGRFLTGKPSFEEFSEVIEEELETAGQ